MPQVVIVSALGPQGQVGPQGPSGSFDNISGSFLYTSSFNAFTASYDLDSASFDARILSNSSSIAILSGSFGSFVTTSSFNAFTASYNTGSFTGSFTGVSNLTSLSASSALVTGNVTVLGTASINTLIVNQTQLSTGSNQLGDAADDTQTLYGTVIIPTGSFAVSGSTTVRDLTLLSTSTSFTSSNDVYNWYLTGKSFYVGSQEASPNGLYFKPDGTKMYITGPTTDRVYAYDLSIPWDITTCIYSGENIIVNSQDTSPIDLYFRSDGLKMYMLGSTNDRVYEYTLSVAWSLTSASFLQFFSISSQETGPGGIYFKPDGTKMYIVGTTSDTVFAYDLGTPWDISTSVYNGENLNIAVQEAGASGISFSNDGSKLYIIGTSGDDITQFNLTTPWNVSTGVFSYESINFDFFLSETTPSGLYYNETVNKAYIIGSGVDNVFELNTNPNLLIQASSSHLSGDLSVAGYTSLNNDVSVKGTVDVTSNITTLANFIGTGTVRITSGIFAGSTSFLPNAMIQIRGSGSSAGSAALRVENTNQSSSLVILDDNTSIFNTNTLYVSGSGLVGIRTTTPTQALDVSGSIALNGNIIQNQTNLDLKLSGLLDGRALRFISSANGARIQAVGSTASNLTLGTTVGGSEVARLTILENGDIGIGTTTPTSKLHVSGTIKIESTAAEKHLEFTRVGNNYISTANGGALLINVVGTAAENTSLFRVYSSAVMAGSGTPLTTATFNVKGSGTTSGTTALLVANSNASSSLVVLDNGNVGIGTSTPGEKLEVVGNIKLGDGTQRNIIGALNNSLGIYASPNSSNEGIIFSTDNGTTAEMFIQNGGNVGIGTTTPTERLQVSGSVSIKPSGTTDTLLFTNLGSTQSRLISNSNFAIWNSGSETVRFLTTGNVGIGNSSPTARLQVRGSGTTSATTAFRVENLNTSSSLAVLDDGNIGIGTSTPLGLLHLKSNFTSGVAIIYDRTQNANVDSLFYTGVSTNGTTATDFMWMGTATSDMTITGTGNVGIGTTTPTSTLDIQSTTTGSIRISGSAGSQITLVRPTAGLTGYVRYVGGAMEIGTAGSDGLNINTLNTTRLNIQTNGDVGIGVVGAPSARLQIRGSGTTSATSTFRLENSSALPSLVVLDNGNVGIGTSTPSSSLHINTASPVISFGVFPQFTQIYGASQSDLNNPSSNAHSIVFKSNQTGIGYGFYFRQTNSNNNAQWTSGTGGTLNLTSGGFFPASSGSGTYRHVDIAYALNGTNGAQTGTGYGIYLNATETSLNGLTSALIDLRSNNTSRFTVLGTGNVGIGTTTPSASLHVSGNLLVTNGITGSLQGTASIAITESKIITFNLGSIPTPITTGSKSTSLFYSPYSGSIKGFILTANTSSTSTLNIWKRNNLVPTSSDTIITSNKPQLISNQLTSSYDVSGWSTSFLPNDVFLIDVETNTSASYISLQLITEIYK